MSKIKYKKPRHRGGRKRYKLKRRVTTGSEKAGNIIKGVLTALALIALVFLGYSICAPIKRYIAERRNDPSAEQTTEWSPAPSETRIIEDGTETAAPSEEISETAASVTVNTAPAVYVPEFTAYAVSDNALMSMELLSEELDRIKADGGDAAVMTLKAKGGELRYRTENTLAAETPYGITAAELAKAAKDRGLEPIARLYMLSDDTDIGSEHIGAFRHADGSVWRDADGVSWLSPYDDDAVGYLSDIAGETAAAGFTYVICTDICFPQFAPEDFAELGESLGFGDRYTALVHTANAVCERIESAGGTMMIEVSADDLVSRRAEVIHPDDLECKNAVIVYDGSDASPEDITSRTGDMTLYGAFSGDREASERFFSENGTERRIIYR